MSDAPVLGGVNKIEDLDAAGDFEKKHTPYVAIEPTGDKYKITVEVGHYVGHPNQADHFIQWIDVLVGDATIAHFDFAAVVAYPSVTVLAALEPGMVVRAIENCTLHGLWAAEVTV